METPSSHVIDLLTTISNCYYWRKNTQRRLSVKSLTTEIISSFPCTSQPRSLHLVHLHKPDHELLIFSVFSGTLGQWGLTGIFCIIYSILIMACNTYTGCKEAAVSFANIYKPETETNLIQHRNANENVSLMTFPFFGTVTEKTQLFLKETNKSHPKN